MYGGTGKAARSWEAYDAIVACLTDLGDDETLLVQSGKPVAVFRTHEMAPRVLIVNSMLVPKWADWETFRELEHAGLTMYGQMTAGSWIYIGTQGILQGTYETLAECAAQHFGGTLAGTVTLTGGLGGMGGAQPLAVTMNGGVALCVEVDPARIERRIKTRYLDRETDSLDERPRVGGARRGPSARPSRSACSATAPTCCPSSCAAAGRPRSSPTRRARTTRSAATCRPASRSRRPRACASRTPTRTSRPRSARWPRTWTRSSTLQERGAVAFDYGNNLRAGAELGGLAHDRAYAYPGFVPAFVRPLFCEGKGPFRWAALSGDPADIAATDRAVAELFPDDERLHRWLTMAADRVAFQGLPARICWLGYGERARAGLRFNELVASGEVSAPIVIGRDHLDAGSVASPFRETEAMADGSDAIADWPILNALINTAAGAHWVSVHHGGGVGIGYSIHAGMVVVADGTEAARERLERVLTTDPGMGVVRHADAGYDRAREVARDRGVRIPMDPAR